MTDDAYPFRFPIQPAVILEPAQFVGAEGLLDALEYPKRWSRQHWHLAFQGNVHSLSQQDFETIEAALQAASRTTAAAR